MAFRLLDLFSGIGGFSLGLEKTGGFQTVAFCEIEDHPRSILKKHWPHVPCYQDVRAVTADKLAQDGICIDAICGGFPCQDISSAGRKAGLRGEKSGLWFEYRRIIGELRPRFAIVENVADLLDRGLGDVLGGLAEIGYDAEWYCIPASFVGAPHHRDRVWIVAYPDSNGKPTLPINDEARRMQAAGEFDWPDHAEVVRVDDGVPDAMGVSSLGNAVVPKIPELIGRAILRAEGVA